MKCVRWCTKCQFPEVTGVSSGATFSYILQRLIQIYSFGCHFSPTLIKRLALMSYISKIFGKSKKALVFDIMSIAYIGFDYPRNPEHKNKWDNDNIGNKNNYA